MSALPPGQSLADLALGEFAARRDAARRKLAARELTPDQAEAHLRPWAALALRCGVDPAELHDDVRQLRDEIVTGNGLSPSRASCFIADDLCPIDRVRAVVGAARDAMISRGITDPTEARGQRGKALIALAIAIGVPNPADTPCLAPRQRIPA